MRIGLLFDNMGVEEELFLKSNKEIERVNSDHLILDLKNSFEYDVIINRIESKHRRRRLTKVIESYGCKVINSFGVEEVCSSKFDTKIALTLKNTPTSRAVFKPGFPFKKKGDRYVKQLTELNKLKNIIKTLKPCIIKPDLGSRGRSIIYIKDENDLENKINTYEETQNIPDAFKPTLITLDGMLIESFQPHALDLRVVVYKPFKNPVKIFGTLIRAAPSEEVIAKNTSLGGYPIGVETPRAVEELVFKCVQALEAYIKMMYGKHPEYYILGVDVLPSNKNLQERSEVYNSIMKLKPYFESVNRAKKTGSTIEIDKAFSEYKNSVEYFKAQETCLKYIESSELLITEVNTTPDFGINTRNLVGDLTACYNEIIRSLF
ncbi:MAG: hypothetical protein OdinLCB4_001910 [Candidatus Odinarchaeum yellowstonii]|uniref:LysX/ArgX preATP-grasp domain-containing protein n=1 Tax=Odinarchaeota yellowstonii (strain LCB_4) TaxID=1841599 RepID=A0AAF0IBS2_ODILC|nr:MAG: hypothetical protein OdinLCB4_001910 [Candidatus Odinarchaeum yellowstonii]